MKTKRKLLAILLAVVMILAMSTTAFAATTDNNNTITVNNAQEGETYKIYKMLDLVVSTDKTAYSYTLNDAWKAFFEEGGAGAAYVNIDNGYVTWKDGKDTDANTEAFAKAAAAYAANMTELAVITATGDAVTFNGLESGYYLITSTKGTLAMVLTTPAEPNATINEKNEDSTDLKQVQEDSTGNYSDSNSAQIGDTVNFKVTLNIQKGAKDVVMHDQMTDGLTFDRNSVEIEGIDSRYYSLVYSDNGALDDGCTFHITFDQDYLDSLTEAAILTVTYSAVLNKNASVESGEINKSQLKWGNNSETEWSSTTTKTYKFEVLKYAGNDTEKNPLAGAVFKLLDANKNVVKLIKVNNTEYRVANGNEAGAVENFTTVSTGNIVIKGVDLDDYYLEEIEAPDGYNKLSDQVKVTVNAANSLVAEVANNAGSTLPTTGGTGTVIFYILGAVLVVCAGVLLVAKRRMSTER